MNNVSIIKKLRININLTNLNKKNIYYLKIIKDNLIQIKNGTINKISIKKFDLIDKNGTFLNEDKFKDFILESINLKLKHCQWIVDTNIKDIDGSIVEKTLSYSFSSKEFTKLYHENKELVNKPKNLFLYKDFDYNEEFSKQYLNNNQILYTDTDLNGIFNLKETKMCDIINKNIQKYDLTGVIVKQTDNILEHYKYHTIIKDFTCRFCMEIIEFSYSPEGQVLCSFFKIN